MLHQAGARTKRSTDASIGAAHLFYRKSGTFGLFAFFAPPLLSRVAFLNDALKVVKSGGS